MLNEIGVVQGDVTQVETDAVVVNLFEGVSKPGGATGAVDSALNDLITELIEAGEITGKRGSSVLIHTPSRNYGGFVPSRVLVMGLGRQEDFNLHAVREVASSAVNRLSRIAGRVSSIVHGAGIGGMDVGSAAEALTVGSMIGTYSFDKYKSGSETHTAKLAALTLVEYDGNKLGEIEAGVRSGRIKADGQNLARDLINEPANVLSPTEMASAASGVAEAGGLEMKVLEESECEALGMGAFVGVARGSIQPAKFVHISYSGDARNPTNNVWLIGKSITFDSGGISLKPARSMGAMKGDMGGGAAVIGAMKIISELKPAINVHAVLPMTENMPGGRAQRPGDVVRAMTGKYIEIDNTDAEGRLTLADGIGYAIENGAARIIDIATLTGAARVALGTGNSAVFGNDQSLIDSVLTSSESAGEGMWQLPLDDTSKRQNRSEVADLKNSGGAPAGSITAAHFISEFAGDVPWVHIDIAATSMLDSGSGIYTVPGATGVPTRTLAHLVEALAG